MPIPDSSLYLACNAVADAISTGIQANTHAIKVYIGAPADISSKTDENRLNLFFYRFEPSGFHAGTHPHDPWRIRIFCLATCMAENGDDQGKDDLRLMGLVMSYLHENRILPSVTVGDETVRLQAIFAPATDEQINQIWSTQGETTYRPSVIYEIALVPIMPETLRGEPPRVGFTGLETVADMAHRYDPFAGNVRAPEISAESVSQTNPAWVPVICWVRSGECQASFSIDVDGTDPATVTPELWIAGHNGDSVDLEWQVWEDEEWSTQAGSSLVISSTAIDPENIPVGLPTVALPSLTVGGHDRWQLLLYATRDYQPFAGAPSVILRSNPILISLYRSSTP